MHHGEHIFDLWSHATSDAEDREPPAQVEPEEGLDRMYGDFSDIRCMKRGRFSSIYKAKHKIDKKHYAIKRLEKRILSESDRRSKQMEAEIHATCSGHPNIIRYHNSWVSPTGVVNIQMEWAGGGTARNYLKEEREKEHVNALLQIGKGLVHIHEKGFAHSDIKLTNVMIRSDAAPDRLYAITDFGVSRLLREKLDLDGDVLYLDPLGLNSVSEGTDAFALGISLYESVRREPLRESEFTFLRSGSPEVFSCLAVAAPQLSKLLSALIDLPERRRDLCGVVADAVSLYTNGTLVE